MMNNELVVATNAGLVDIQIEYRSLADLLLDKRNPRQHPQRQIDQLAEFSRADRSHLLRYGTRSTLCGYGDPPLAEPDGP